MWMIITYVLLLGAVSASPDPVLTTTSGEVKGTKVSVDQVDVQQFLAVPYAETTAGNNRYDRPRAVKTWSGVRDATHWGASCPQGADDIEMQWLLADRNTSEDCLTVNLWIPTDAKNKPVMVFIYGGGFQVGANNVPVYNGAALAAIGGVPVAVINYRVGIFGMLDLGVDGAHGNQMFYDQMLALEWIAKNAANIGGDPDNIVLIGESAGATAVGILLLHPVAQKLFSKAIMMSGSPLSNAYLESSESSLKKTEKISKSVGCLAPEVPIGDADKTKLLGCLRDLPIEKLVAAQNEIGPMVFMPTFPNNFFPKDPRLEPKPASKPLLIGYTPMEGSFIAYFIDKRVFDFSKTPHYSDTQYEFLFQAFFKGFTDNADIAEIYKNQGGGNFEGFVNALSDAWVKCPVNRYASASDGSSTFMYEFELVNQGSHFGPASKTTHLDDIPILFASSFLDGKNFPLSEQSYSRKIIRTLIRFATQGSPGPVDGVEWPSFKEGQQRLVLSPDNVHRIPLNQSICQYW